MHVIYKHENEKRTNTSCQCILKNFPLLEVAEYMTAMKGV